MEKIQQIRKSHKINHNGNDVIDTANESNNQQINYKNRYKQPQQKYKKITKKEKIRTNHKI